ncbi:MAG: hypothetical protein AB7U81_11395 [Thiohalomonadaceae bacterium]
MRQRLPVVLALLLTACAAPRPDPDSPYYLLPEGSTAVLEQPVTIPAPGVSVWIQDGRVSTGRDRYRPACKLEMRDRPDRGRTVEPDTFRVTRVGRNQMQVSLDSHLRRVVLGNRDDGPTAFEMETHIYLESERQPQVYRLVCAHWSGGVGTADFPEPLSINQIRGTLQGIFRIELP